jgi:hypothetical protein
MVRITHWLNPIAIIIMIGSGWGISSFQRYFSGVDDIGWTARHLAALAH